MEYISERFSSLFLNSHQSYYEALKLLSTVFFLFQHLNFSELIKNNISKKSYLLPYLIKESMLKILCKKRLMSYYTYDWHQCFGSGFIKSGSGSSI
jgi:hypothetical protein